MSFITKSVILLFAVLMVSCSVGPYEEPENPQVPEGPGLFTGKKGEYSLSDLFSDDNKARKRRPNSQSGEYYPTYNDVDYPAIDEQSFRGFEEFKAWRRAQDPNSPNYQEYQDWRAYQQYLRFKAQQQTAPAPSEADKAK